MDTYNNSKKRGSSESETDDDTWTVSEEILGEIEFKVLGQGAKGGINITNTNNFGLVKTTTTQEEETYDHGYTQDNTTTTSTTTVFGKMKVSQKVSKKLAPQMA